MCPVCLGTAAALIGGGTSAGVGGGFGAWMLRRWRRRRPKR
jgi:hypothetical protein